MRRQAALQRNNMHVPETDRLYMRPFEHDDVDTMFTVFNDELSLRFYPRMSDPRLVAGWVIRWRDVHKRDGVSLWALCLKSTDEMIGDCGLVWQDIDEGRRLEIGYHIAAQHRRRGYAREAAAACRNHAFEQLRQERVISIVASENIASRTVAANVHRNVRTGFKRAGKTRLIFWTDRSDCGSLNGGLYFDPPATLPADPGRDAAL